MADTSGEILSPGDRSDLLVAFHQHSYEAHRAQLRDGGVLLYDADTVKPDADQLFDVLAAAEQDGDTLSVALAVKGASPLRQALDLTLVVDRSCSMEDEGRMDFTKRGLSVMSDQLTDGDRLDVVLFDDRVCVPLENLSLIHISEPTRPY